MSFTQRHILYFLPYLSIFLIDYTCYHHVCLDFTHHHHLVYTHEQFIGHGDTSDENWDQDQLNKIGETKVGIFVM